MIKIILDLCGGTGAWSKPYSEAGYDVRVITLPEHDVRTYKPPKNVYGILAAPPCTMFSVARTRAKQPRDFAGGLEIVNACLRIIREVTLDHKIAFWALENPRGYLRHFIGLPAYTFQPYDFGEPYKKRTDLWGFFKFPVKKPVKPDNRFNSKNGEDWHHNGIKKPRGMKMSDYRAITPTGFAKAFFEANK